MKRSKKLSSTDLLEHLLTVSRHMAEMRHLDDLLAYAIDKMLQLVGAEWGYIVLVNENDPLDFRTQRKARGMEAEFSSEPSLPGDPISHSILDQVVQTGQSLVVEDAMFDPRFQSAHSVMAMQLRSIMCAPLITQNRTIGAIYVENRTQSGRFANEDIVPLEFFSTQAAVAIENADLYTNLETLVEERTEALVQAKKEAERAREVAETANKAKSTFLANMSHELRTPLNAILGFSNLMRREALWGVSTLTKPQQENLGLIYRSGEHLLTLINNVLDLSKIEAGKTTLNVGNFDLHRLLDDLVEMFSLKVEEKGVKLLLERSPEVPTFVNTDMVKLKQVFLNLLSNALKFTEQGGIFIRVSCLNEQCTRIHMEVEDTGPGIAANELDTLFEAFAQTATGRSSKEGTGLGLAISREFIALMGGKLDVRSEVNKGTVFFFEIDVELVEKTEVKEEMVVRQIVGLKPSQENYRILIVDDNESNRQLLVKLLEPLGLDLREAGNGQEAVETWREWEPQLIWMDMRMPIMDGYEATKAIKAEPKGQETKIIALTASSYEEEKAGTMTAGCDDYYRKPFKEEEIFEAMHYHIGVEYVYEEIEEETSKVGPTEILTPEALKVVPAELLAKLEELAVQANIMEVDKVIEKIRLHDEGIAQALTDLADGFEYPKIAEVARAAINLETFKLIGRHGL